MKKNIYSLVVLAMTMVGVTACHPDFEGLEPGNDKNPKATLYTYTPTSADGNYDADTDVRLRIAGNDKTEQVYYKAIKTATREGMTEEQVISEVLSSGQSVSKPGEGASVMLTGMQGKYTICAVAVNGGDQALTETSFFGLTWTTVKTGSLRTRFADGATTAYDYLEGVELQKSEDKEGSYRLKNPWGTGVNLPIDITLSHEEYDASGWADEGADDYFENEVTPYQYILMPKTEIGVNTPDYGSLSVGDYTSVRGSDYTYYCRMYKDYFIAIYSYWTGGGVGNIGSGWTYYYPD